MLEGGMLPRDPTGSGAGTLSAPTGDVSAVPVSCTEDVAGLLGFLAAGGALAGVVGGLLARLLVTDRNHHHDEPEACTVDGGGEGSVADGAGSVDGEGLFAGDSRNDTALMAGTEGRWVVSVKEAGISRIMGLGAIGLEELVAVCHRLMTWASWGQSLAAACLTAYGELSSHPGQWGPDGRVSPVVGYEERRFNTTYLLSARLGVSRSRAGRTVDHGSTLMDMGFNPTEVIERCGVLDTAKTSLVTHHLEGVPTLAALVIQEQVLPQAPRRNMSQVGHNVEWALVETDPARHAERARANQGHRCVTRPGPADEGMSQVHLLLPAMDALLLDAVLDAVAASARAAGEQRTPTQLRTDAITAMTLSTLRTSQQTTYHRPTQTPDDDTQSTTPTRSHGNNRDRSLDSSLSDSGSISDGITDDLESAEGFGDVNEPGSMPVPLVPPRCSASPERLLPDGVPLEGLLSSLSSLMGSASSWWTPSDTGRLPFPASTHIDIRVTVPLTSLASLAPPEDPTGKDDLGSGEYSEGSRHPRFGGASPGQNPTVTAGLNGTASRDNGWSLPTATSNRRSLPTADERTLPGSSGRSPPAPSPATPVSQATASTSVSLSTAGEVAQARIKARSTAVPTLTAWVLAVGGAWRRPVTDPASGAVVDVGRTRYRLPADLVDLIRAYDRACASPTCQTPAEHCDIGHLTAWSQGGTTGLSNLATLCQAHRHLRYTPGWTFTRDQATGTLSWHTPDKTIYQHHPDGTIIRLPHKTGPHQHHTPITVTPADLSQQINPGILSRLSRALDTALDDHTHNHTSPGTSTNGRARLEAHGPQPGRKPGAFEPTPYPKATCTLQLVPLIDVALLF